MASIFGSDAPLQGGSLEMLELEAVLHRDEFDWLLPCRLIPFFRGVRGAWSRSSGKLLPAEERKQLKGMVAMYTGARLVRQRTVIL